MLLTSSLYCGSLPCESAQRVQPIDCSLFYAALRYLKHLGTISDLWERFAKVVFHMLIVRPVHKKHKSSPDHNSVT